MNQLWIIVGAMILGGLTVALFVYLRTQFYLWLQSHEIDEDTAREIRASLDRMDKHSEKADASMRKGFSQ